MYFPPPIVESGLNIPENPFNLIPTKVFLGHPELERWHGFSIISSAVDRYRRWGEAKG
jgi:hypothetical protein